MSFENISFTLIFGIFCLLIGVLATRHYSSRRRLSIVVTSVLDLIKVSGVVKEKVKIWYDGKRVESLWVVRVVLQNRGNLDIDASMVRSSPKIMFQSGAKPIDVEHVYVDPKSSVTAAVTEESKVVFDVDYLQSRSCAAFQVIAHCEEGVYLRPDDVRCEGGIIENTSVKIVNMVDVPASLGTFVHVLRRSRKLVVRIYWIISFVLIAAGLIMLIQPILIRKFDITILGVESIPTTVAIGVILYGALLFVPTLWLSRRVRYLGLFPPLRDRGLKS